MPVALKHDPATLPERMRDLPVDERGYLIPWFVPYVDGKPEFRAMDPEKYRRSLRDRLCWVCGKPLGRYLCFTIGPMCALNRTTSEPPEHLECAEWSVKNCPFLSRPKMHRREFPMGKLDPIGGIMIERNPGVSLLWVTKSFEVWRDENGHPLIEVGEPIHLFWYAEGRTATRAEIDESINTGLPILEEQAKFDGEAGIEALQKALDRMVKLLPKV